MMLLLDYLRLVSYSIVILSCLRGITHKKFASILFLGDVAMASAMVLANVLACLLGMDRHAVAHFIITPGVMIWASIHLHNLLKKNGGLVG